MWQMVFHLKFVTTKLFLPFWPLNWGVQCNIYFFLECILFQLWLFSRGRSIQKSLGGRFHVFFKCIYKFWSWEQSEMLHIWQQQLWLKLPWLRHTPISPGHLHNVELKWRHVWIVLPGLAELWKCREKRMISGVFRREEHVWRQGQSLFCHNASLNSVIGCEAEFRPRSWALLIPFCVSPCLPAWILTMGYVFVARLITLSKDVLYVCVYECVHCHVWFANQQFSGVWLSTPPLPPPPPPLGKQAGGGKQKRSHCEGEATGLFLLWEEMHTNVLPVRPPPLCPPLLLLAPSFLSHLTHVAENQERTLLNIHLIIFFSSWPFFAKRKLWFNNDLGQK